MLILQGNLFLHSPLPPRHELSTNRSIHIELLDIGTNQNPISGSTLGLTTEKILFAFLTLASLHTVTADLLFRPGTHGMNYSFINSITLISGGGGGSANGERSGAYLRLRISKSMANIILTLMKSGGVPELFYSVGIGDKTEGNDVKLCQQVGEETHGSLIMHSVSA